MRRRPNPTRQFQAGKVEECEAWSLEIRRRERGSRLGADAGWVAVRASPAGEEGCLFLAGCAPDVSGWCRADSQGRGRRAYAPDASQPGLTTRFTLRNRGAHSCAGGGRSPCRLAGRRDGPRHRLSEPARACVNRHLHFGVFGEIGFGPGAAGESDWGPCSVRGARGACGPPQELSSDARAADPTHCPRGGRGAPCGAIGAIH